MFWPQAEMNRVPKSRWLWPAVVCLGVVFGTEAGQVSLALSSSSDSLSAILANNGADVATTADNVSLQEVTVTSQRPELLGSATTASEGVVTAEELQLIPAFRPAQLLETVPGLSVTVHSGEGKAAQYLMRGYNLDHGTDLAVTVEGMPVNEPTQAHGQGYADLNFIIPDLATALTYTQGTYYADQGDFASVGSISINYPEVIPAQVSVTAGDFGYRRLFIGATEPLNRGDLLGGLELEHYDGPWDPPTDQRKLNAVLRYSGGDTRDGFSITGMFYHDLWNAATDQPVRAFAESRIGRYGTLGPSDGGYARRASVSLRYAKFVGDGELRLSAYVINNRLTLWNDFTHYLFDPVYGDQEAQSEDRATVGGDLSFEEKPDVEGFKNDLAVGLHSRYDINDVSRWPTQNRRLITGAQLAAADYPTTFLEGDHVHLASAAAYVQATTHWNVWLRSVVGFREDYVHGIDSGTNPGVASASLAEPKANLILMPTGTTELYFSWGRGFHSDDLRGVNQARMTAIGGAPLIARQTGEEVGVRQHFGDNLTMNFAVYNLVAQSETTYDPDIGQDTAGPGSRRHGAELTVTYQALRWLEIYGSSSYNHARYTSLYMDGTGHVGYYLPNAPFAAGSFNVNIRNLGPWSGGLGFRYLSAFPLSSDDVIQGHGYAEWNGVMQYRFPTGWKLGVGVYNIFNKRADAAEFWYVDRLAGEPAEGVPDVHFHPLEPLSVRLTVAKIID